MKIGIAQINTTVGDFAGNVRRIAEAYEALAAGGADLVITPELAVVGYPPLDLLFKSQFVPRNLQALQDLAARVTGPPLIAGAVSESGSETGRPFANTAAVLAPGQAPRFIAKRLLPTYDVFDEARYFEPGGPSAPIPIAGRHVGVTICEDVWTEHYLPRRMYPHDPVADLVAAGADLVVNLSASPFSIGKPARRMEMLSAIARKHAVPLAYCNLAGGNDQLVFDGHSLAFDASGRTVAVGAGFAEHYLIADLDGPHIAPEWAGDAAQCHDALVLGLRDYCRKCGFRSAILGLSGGIDSAVTAAIAVKALGRANVTGVALPTRYSSEASVSDARDLAERLGIAFHIVPIEPVFEAMREAVAPALGRPVEGLTEENIQPRLRATVLMAFANAGGHLLLTTGNKSELAVGYCTIYGDMAGGLAVISDVPKTRVYELARWINREHPIIPENTIAKPPSAELRPDQKDQDTLPPYEVLDAILALYVEEMATAAEIAARGFDEKTVRWVARKVDLNEWKRQQAAPGLKVTARAFGLGRRVPIAQRFVE